MGPVERAIKATFKAPVTRHTMGLGVPFKLSVIDRKGIVLLLGRQESPSRLSWECLESIPVFLRRQTGWVPAGGAHSITGEPGTFDEYLKRYQKTDVARWLAVILNEAGVVELSERWPLRLRLNDRF